MKRERPDQATQMNMQLKDYFILSFDPHPPKPNRPVRTRPKVTRVPPGEPQALALTQILV